MKPQNAAALVVAGMVSVLVHPIIGSRRMESEPTGTQATVNPEHPAGEGG